MSALPHPDRIPVLALLRRDAAADTICRLLAEAGFDVRLRDPGDVPDVWRESPPPQAVLVDENLEPDTVGEAVEEGWIPGTSPVFLLARRLPDRDRYLAWLQAGAWDILKVPLEAVALELRLHNLLRGRIRDGVVGGPAAAYSMEALTRVAEETLSLAGRYERPLQCLALGLNWPDAPGTRAHALLDRLAAATESLTRRSDLIGRTDERSLLILLPDTDRAGAETFAERLEETLRSRLREWGVVATLRTSIIPGEGRESGAELLDAAARALR